MDVIQLFADIVSYRWMGLIPDSYLGSAVNFFILDFVKIGVLLLLVNYLMAVIRYYFPMEKARDVLSKKHWLPLSYLLAALLGVITPFCSCSSIPLFIGFLGAGIPLGITFTFLISSPLINEASLYLFPAIFGWQVTVLYNLFGIFIAIMGGMLIQKLKLDKYVIPKIFVFKSKKEIEKEKGEKIPFKELVPLFFKEGNKITKSLLLYVVLGIALGALIHGFVPSGLIEQYLSGESFWTVPIAVLLAVPLYANSITVLPIMEALVNKGASFGTVLSFMTAVVALSLPEALMLKKVMRWPLLAIFFGITIFGIILMGYLFNFIF
ncbi:MAG: permease [Bacilli bacterium]|nr:permease [Bacilli bacterium]